MLSRIIDFLVHTETHQARKVFICCSLVLLFYSSAIGYAEDTPEFSFARYANFVEREGWGAVPPKVYPKLEKLSLPVAFVVLSYFIPSITDDVLALQVIQRNHMDAGLPDIQSNFLIGRNGTIYVGRGWKIKPARSLDFPHYDGKFIEIAYIGNFNDEPMLHPIYNATWDLLKFGIFNKYIVEDFVILTEKHRKIAD
ncbi:N-acetylmuramoyl-L-alanine amidase [Homalodisca vitripennis]|nr:N-acetylmuramoyl-L-alanine amidase [Homalodisca vitripennis]